MAVLIEKSYSFIFMHSTFPFKVIAFNKGKFDKLLV